MTGRPRRRERLPWLVVTLLALACGPDDVPAPPATRVRENLSAPAQLFTPWHAASEPLPFPQGEQWYYRDRLSWPPVGLRVPEDEEAAARLTEGLEAIRGWPLLETEAALGELQADASRAPHALIAALDDGDRDMRWHAARLLHRCIPLVSADQRSLLASAAAMHLRDSAEEISLLHLESIARSALPWTTLRLLKCFGRYDNHPMVSVRARAAMHLAGRGYASGMDLMLRILKERTRLQDDIHRDFDPSLRTAWWKEEAIAGIALLAGQDFGYSPDATVPEQERVIVEIERWWEDHRVLVWSRAPRLDDPELRRRVQEILLGMGTFQLRNVDNSVFLLTHLGPSAAPLVIEALRGSSFAIQHHCLDVLATWMTWVPVATREQWRELLVPFVADAAQPRLQEKALWAIGCSRLPSALPLLKSQLSAGPGLGQVAIRSLGQDASPEARKVLVEFQATLDASDPLWLPTQAARIRAGDLAPLEDFLDLLRTEGPIADRASIYLAWLTDSDPFAEADNQEQREAAIAGIEAEIRSRVEH